MIVLKRIMIPSMTSNNDDNADDDDDGNDDGNDDGDDDNDKDLSMTRRGLGGRWS